MSLFSLPFPLPLFHVSPRSSPNTVGFLTLNLHLPWLLLDLFSKLWNISCSHHAQTPLMFPIAARVKPKHASSPPSSWEMKSHHFHDCSHFSTCLDTIFPHLCLSLAQPPAKPVSSTTSSEKPFPKASVRTQAALLGGWITS